MTFEEKVRQQFEEFGPLHEEGCPSNDEDGQDPCACVVMAELTEVAMKALSAQKTEIISLGEGLKKEQLDKSDPDNYEACYAIAGFNDAIEVIKAKILEL